MRPDPVPFAIGDEIRLKKPHPCGGFDWTVVRLGADIGIRCQGCGRRVLLPRRELERRLKQFLVHVSETGIPAVTDQLDPGEAGAGETGV